MSRDWNVINKRVAGPGGPRSKFRWRVVGATTATAVAVAWRGSCQVLPLGAGFTAAVAGNSRDGSAMSQQQPALRFMLVAAVASLSLQQHE